MTGEPGVIPFGHAWSSHWEKKRTLCQGLVAPAMNGERRIAHGVATTKWPFNRLGAVSLSELGRSTRKRFYASPISSGAARTNSQGEERRRKENEFVLASQRNAVHSMNAGPNSISFSSPLGFTDMRLTLHRP